MANDGVDLAVAAYREEGVWQVQALTHDHLEDVDDLVDALRRFPGDGGSLGMVVLDQVFGILVRVQGATVRLVLNDISAADEFDLADSVRERIGVPDEADDDGPAGDLDILADAGISSIDLGLLLEDDDLYPDELFSDLAHRLGFGRIFDDLADLS